MEKITTTYHGDMLFATRIGDHTLTIDVPAKMGGKDRGPTPPELFIASLGSCVGAFVAQYCERAGIDTGEMTVDIAFNKAEGPTRLTDLKVIITLPHGDCSGREAPILRVAEHCPVHETIATMESITFTVIGKEMPVRVLA